MIPKNTKSITSEWLNSVLHKNNFLKKENITSVICEPCGEGEGLIGDISRIIVTYDGDGSHLPNTMIAKWHPSDDIFYSLGIQLGFLEKEVRFYSELAPISPIRVPDLIYSDFDLNSNRFALLLEDCSKYTSPDFFKGLDYDQTKIAVTSLARFHSRWWNADDLYSFKWLHENKQSLWSFGYKSFNYYWKSVKQKEEFITDLPEKGLELGEKYQKKIKNLGFENVPNHFTIIHGDVKIASLFIDNNDPINPLIFFDWGNMHIGFGTFDLAGLLCTSVSVELRRKYENHFVKLYMDLLVENGVDLSDLTFKDFWYNYLRDLLKYIVVLPAQYLLNNYSQRHKEVRKIYIRRIFTAILDNDIEEIFPV